MVPASAKLYKITPAVEVENLTCTLDADGLREVPLGSINLPAALGPSASITCTFAVTVTSSHAQNGQIPAFTVDAVLETVPADESLAIESITVPPVPVSTGATLAVTGPILRATQDSKCEQLQACCDVRCAAASTGISNTCWACAGIKQHPLHC